MDGLRNFNFNIGRERLIQFVTIINVCHVNTTVNQVKVLAFVDWIFGRKILTLKCKCVNRLKIIRYKLQTQTTP